MSPCLPSLPRNHPHCQANYSDSDHCTKNQGKLAVAISLIINYLSCKSHEMNIQKQFHKFAIFKSNLKKIAGIKSFSNTKSFTFTPILFFIKEQNK